MQNFIGVASRGYLGVFFHDFAGRVDDKGFADNAFVLAAHKLLEAPSAVGCNSGVGGVAEQGEVEIVFGGKFGV